MPSLSEPNLPDWVPEDVRRYLAHTETGTSIRRLARRAGCHASTVMRQVRRIEARREDPLVDLALAGLAARHFQPAAAGSTERAADGPVFGARTAEVLACLSRAGAILAFASGMENAVVLRQAQEPDQKLVVAQALAGAIALRDWIACSSPGRVWCYRITPAGRGALSRLLAARENRALGHSGFAEAGAAFAGLQSSRKRRLRYGEGDTPLTQLSRLSGPGGAPFLSPGMVQAGERLREDFELAQIGGHLQAAQAQFADGSCGPQTGPQTQAPAAAAARDRAARALNALGPGLSDITLRCCCHLEGLEAAERQLGWSARSGKVVLRIALERLETHYRQQENPGGLIG